MCGWHTMAPNGYFSDAIVGRGAWIKLSGRTNKPNVKYFRVHDDLAKDRANKHRIILELKSFNWTVEACVTVTRCYGIKPKWDTGVPNHANTYYGQNQKATQELQKPTCTCGMTQARILGHSLSCPMFPR